MTPEDLRAEMERVRAKHAESCGAEGKEAGLPWPCDAYRLAGALLKILDLHKGAAWCDECGKSGLCCPTIQALVQEMEER